MMPRGPARSRGSTLLEVALAVALLAMSGIGLVATQLSLSRHGRSTAVRAQAAFIADAFAEMTIEGGQGASSGDQWKARTSVLIPGGIASTDGGDASMSRAVVSWPATSDAPSSCAGASASSGRECVSLGFTR